MKTCNICNQDKDETEFYNKQHRCKKCHNKRCYNKPTIRKVGSGRKKSEVINIIGIKKLGALTNDIKSGMNTLKVAKANGIPKSTLYDWINTGKLEQYL